VAGIRSPTVTPRSVRRASQLAAVYLRRWPEHQAACRVHDPTRCLTCMQRFSFAAAFRQALDVVRGRDWEA